MNKLTPYILSVAVAAAQPATSAQAPDDYRTQMQALALQHEQASDPEGRRAALDAMDKLDKSLKGTHVKERWAALDENTATAADYRRTGIMMAAAGEKKACNWCFRKGAQLGEPYCANIVLKEQLKELGNLESATFLLPRLTGWTLPLLHNMALALFVMNTSESVKTTRELARTFFTMFDDTRYRYNIYNYSEYLDYRDEPQRRELGMCWFDCPGSIQIGKTLRMYLDASK